MMKRKALIVLTIVALVTPVAASALTFSELQAKWSALQQKISAYISASPGQANVDVQTNISIPPPRICSIFPLRTLYVGLRGDDVVSLQEFLRAEGFFSANATGYFGPLTAQALARWQASQGISAVGILGPVTRERIKARCGGGGVGGGGGGDLSASPSHGPAPLTVNFTYPGKEENAQYYIEFGDGAAQVMGTQQIYCIRAPCISPSVASHTYTSAGTYTASVSHYIACLYTNPRCMVAQPPPLAYVQITVRASGGNGAPVISSFSGPTRLTLNESGTWSILASDPENGPLTYSIQWGDEWYASNAMMQSSAQFSIMQTTTFTHSYAYSGTYTIYVVVRDSTGQEARTSMTVYVENAPVACTLQYDPVCGRPPGCANTCPPGMYCTMVCRLHDPVTYGNRCQLNAAGAEFLYAGACTTN